MLDALFRLGLALLLGAAIGIERQWHQKMAGLRTNALVALGAGGFCVFSALVAEGDPTRGAAQVVSGMRRLNERILSSGDAETHYTVEFTCRAAEEAEMRALLLRALTGAGLGLRRIDSADLPETTKAKITAQAAAHKRSDAALEEIVGRLSREPHVTAAAWQVDRAIPES